MEEKTKLKVIKKTVVIHPIMDSYIRKTWSLLVEAGYDATYSSAVNMMLLMAIMEIMKKQGLTAETRKTIWDFAGDIETINTLNLQDHIAQLEKQYQMEKRKR